MQPLKTDCLETGIVEYCLTIRFTRPELRNPLSINLLKDLDRIIESCSRSSDEIRSIVFTGTGSVFASGADLREIAEVTADAAREFAQHGQDLMTKINALPQSTVAAINGFCFGGALDLALACDRRIASLNARFAHPGAGLGIITGWGGTQRLPRLIGQGLAFELFFTAEPVDAGRALSIGLVDEIADDPLSRALQFVRGE
jgi:enoyl-CoA hydratase